MSALCAGAAAWLAFERQRNVVLWTLFGAILGPMALVLLVIAPPGRCGYCGARVRGWGTTCARCGHDVNGPPDDGVIAEPTLRPLISVVPTQRVAYIEPVPMSAAVHDAGNGTTARPVPAPVVAVAVEPEPEPRRPAPPSKSRAAATRTTATPATSAAAPVKSAAKPVATKAGRQPAAATKAAVEKPAAKTTRASTAKQSRKTAAPEPDAEPPVPQAIGGGVYYSGTAPLSAGSRYTLRFLGPNLQVLGPHDRDPRRVAFERSVTGADADVTDDRLVISLGDGRNTTLLVFVAVEGGRPAALAQMIRDAALVNGSHA